MQSKKYYIAALSAFILWGFFSLALKPIKHFSPLDILFYRVFSAAFLITIINVLFRKKQIKQNVELFKSLSVSEKRSTLGLTFLGGALLTFNWLFLFML